MLRILAGTEPIESGLRTLARGAVTAYFPQQIEGDERDAFHTVLAVLSALALRFVPYLRWGVALLSALIIISTITTGWHYLVDILAGFLIAAVSVLVGKGHTRLEARHAASGRTENKVPSPS